MSNFNWVSAGDRGVFGEHVDTKGWVEYGASLFGRRWYLTEQVQGARMHNDSVEG